MHCPGDNLSTVVTFLNSSMFVSGVGSQGPARQQGDQDPAEIARIEEPGASLDLRGGVHLIRPPLQP